MLVGVEIGGFFVDIMFGLGLYWCYRYIDLPIGAVTFLVLFLYLDVHNPRTPVWRGLKAVDWLDSISLLAVTLLVLLGLNFG